MKDSVLITGKDDKLLGKLSYDLNEVMQNGKPHCIGRFSVQDENGISCATLVLDRFGAHITSYFGGKVNPQPHGELFMLEKERFPAFCNLVVDRLGKQKELRAQSLVPLLNDIVEEAQGERFNKRFYNSGPTKIPSRHERVDALFPDNPAHRGGYIDVIRDDAYLTRYVDSADEKEGALFHGKLKVYKNVKEGDEIKHVHIATIKMTPEKDTLQVLEPGFLYGRQEVDIPRAVEQEPLREGPLFKALVAQLATEMVHGSSANLFTTVTGFFNELDLHRNAASALVSSAGVDISRFD